MEHEKYEGADPLWARLLFLIGYWWLGAIAFWLASVLGLAQLIMLWGWGQKHEGLRSSSALLVRYVCDCLAYITFASDDKPFPLGALPKEM